MNLPYYDANKDHDEIGVIDGFFCHKNCHPQWLELKGKKWRPLTESDHPTNRNGCVACPGSGLYFKIVDSIPHQLSQHFI